jgi:hypothetical protein
VTSAAILLTATTQAALGEADGFYLRPVGAVPLRRIEARSRCSPSRCEGRTV